MVALWATCLPAKGSGQKQQRNSGDTIFHIISIRVHVLGFFFQMLKTTDSTVRCRIWPNFELAQLSFTSLLPDQKQSRKLGDTFPHYNPMGDICCHGNQSSDPIWPKT